MKNTLVMFLMGLIVGVGLTILAIVVIVPKQMFIVKESLLGFDQTIVAIEKSAADNQWGIPFKYDLQATLKGKGFEVQPVNVISLCKPVFANEILSDNNERLVSALMPCRVAVYEKEGKTYVSMLNAALFAKFLNKKSKQVMSQASEENEKILAPLIKN
jgi:uncharacterized protein (DUF302 family)